MGIDEWIHTWGDTMIRLSYLIVQDRELAQDVAQEAFLRLYQRLNERPGEPLSVGWLYAVTKNLARDMRRKTRRLSETFSLYRMRTFPSADSSSVSSPVLMSCTSLAV